MLLSVRFARWYSPFSFNACKGRRVGELHAVDRLEVLRRHLPAEGLEGARIGLVPLAQGLVGDVGQDRREVRGRFRAAAEVLRLRAYGPGAPVPRCASCPCRAVDAAQLQVSFAMSMSLKSRYSRAISSARRCCSGPQPSRYSPSSAAVVRRRARKNADRRAAAAPSACRPGAVSPPSRVTASPRCEWA